MTHNKRDRPHDAAQLAGHDGGTRHRADPAALDYRSAFELAPVGLVLSRQRQVIDCNLQLLSMFGAERAQLVGQSLEILYPTAAEFERTGQRIAAQLDKFGRYADERVMKRLAPLRTAGLPTTGISTGAASPVGKTSKTATSRTGGTDGELFWCHVSGRALDPAQPHAAGIWAFEDLSAKRALKFELTPREREIAALLMEGLTSKLIGRRLDISPRTVDVYRARLMRKTGAATTPELVTRLLSDTP